MSEQHNSFFNYSRQDLRNFTHGILFPFWFAIGSLIALAIAWVIVYG